MICWEKMCAIVRFDIKRLIFVISFITSFAINMRGRRWKEREVRRKMHFEKLVKPNNRTHDKEFETSKERKNSE